MGSKTSRERKSISFTFLWRRNILDRKRDLWRSFPIDNIFFLIIGYPLSEKKFWVKDDLIWLGFPINIPEKVRNSRSETQIRSSKITTFKRNPRTFAKPGPISCGILTMGLANVPVDKAFFGKLLCIFRKYNIVRKKLAENRRIRTKNLGGGILKTPAVYNA